MTYVHYGCGHHAPDQWLNFDASLTLRVEHLPALGRLVKKNASRFPSNVLFGDIVRGLPVADGSAQGAYASHVLEHLSRDSMAIALRNTFRMLQPGGVFRLIVPDLETRARRYLADLEAGRNDANDRLLRDSYLGLESEPSGLIGHLSDRFGKNKHLWMWDYPSIKSALETAGFVAIRRCEIGDSGDPAFAAVEQQNRFYDEQNHFRELAVHCERPPAS